MTELLAFLMNFADLLLVMFGFGLIIFLHELGHFVAARWAGIRVLAFAVGFGPAVVSYRKGMGLRRGSSEAEYLKQLNAEAVGAKTLEAAPPTHHSISSTEYRLNALPLGGYVKMLGQEDMDPTATSEASDSYQNCKPWKRMVVISAGVVMNMITAAVLFVIVFMVGLKVEPPIIGTVSQGSPAAMATAVMPDDAAIGLQPGDVVIDIDGRRPRHFSDVMVAGAIGKKGVPVRLTVQRVGSPEPIEYSIVAEESGNTGLLDFGVSPGRTMTLPVALNDEERAVMDEFFTSLGLDGVEPGMTLTRIGNNTDPKQPGELLAAFATSGGEPVELGFVPTDPPSKAEVAVELKPVPRLESSLVPIGESVMPHTHLLGLAGVLRVWPGADPADVRQGLEPGDVFARLGEVEYPSLPQGIAAIRANKGRTIDAVVLRSTSEGASIGVETVELTLSVNRKGLVGFQPDTTESDSTRLSSPLLGLRERSDGAGEPASGETLAPPPGSRVVSVGGERVSTFAQLRAVLIEQTSGAYQNDSTQGVVLPITLELAGPASPDGTLPRMTLDWSISSADIGRLHALGWDCPLPIGVFEPIEILDKAEGPVAAIGLGLDHTRRVMLQTYLTFARLFQGTVKVEHLQGPVGIAHLGTRLADRGFVWLLFFMALISVNLAVINFMPLPIVDGGQFLMLVYEQLRGKPVPIPFQNTVTMAGLLLIGTMFLIVTFNDLTRLFGF